MARAYEYIEHTADLGIRTYGRDPADLFEHVKPPRAHARGFPDKVLNRFLKAPLDPVLTHGVKGSGSVALAIVGEGKGCDLGGRGHI